MNVLTEKFYSGDAMSFDAAVLDAARTVREMQEYGARAGEVAGFLGCARDWKAIELEMRARNLTAHLPWSSARRAA